MKWLSINPHQSLKKSTDIARGLERFVPQNALDPLCTLIEENPCHLRITPPRKTKLGDFRPAPKGLHHISVNGDLNPYSFTITLVHEIAHLQVWDTHGPKVKPHGIEWKNTFQALLAPFITSDVFPAEVEVALSKYISNPKASSCSDIELMRALSLYDKQQSTVIESLAPGMIFTFKGRDYVMEKKRRTRFECKRLSDYRTYLFHARTPVEPVENQAAQ